MSRYLAGVFDVGDQNMLKSHPVGWIKNTRTGGVFVSYWTQVRWHDNILLP